MPVFHNGVKIEKLLKIKNNACFIYIKAIFNKICARIIGQ